MRSITWTGRISNDRPNMQSILHNTPEVKASRTAFEGVPVSRKPATNKDTVDDPRIDPWILFTPCAAIIACMVWFIVNDWGRYDSTNALICVAVISGVAGLLAFYCRSMNKVIYVRAAGCKFLLT